MTVITKKECDLCEHAECCILSLVFRLCPQGIEIHWDGEDLCPF